MENWSIDSLGEIGGVSCRSPLAGNGGKTNLVVDDDVNGSADGVVCQILHLHRFIDDSLSGKGGVSMDEHWHYSSSFIFIA